MISPARVLAAMVVCGLLVGIALAKETRHPIKTGDTAFNVRIVRLVYRRPKDERVYFRLVASTRCLRGGHR